MSVYSTRTLTRDGLTYTAEFHLGEEHGYRVTRFTVGAAGQVIDLLRDAPQGATEAAVDAWFIKTHRQLSMLADEVYEKGDEIRYDVVREAA